MYGKYQAYKANAFKYFVTSGTGDTACRADAKTHFVTSLTRDNTGQDRC